MTASELAVAIGKSYSTVKRYVKALTEKGLVEREGGKGNRNTNQDESVE